MTTTIAPNFKPDQAEIEEWPALDQEPAETTAEQHDGHFSDPTQGRQLGSNPYDDPTQGRKIGSDPYDDPTRAR